MNYQKNVASEVTEEPFEVRNVQEVHERKIARTDIDAVHPRFQTADPEDVRQFQTRNDYYCEYCNQFFAPTVEALNVHFRGDMVQHRPCGTCFYCKGVVFEYKLNNQRQLYHDCRKHRPNQEPSTE